MLERLQKILARAGVSSRRASEEIILAGRVRVNGRIVNELGAKADTRTDKVELDGRKLVAEPFVYIAYHKPRGVVSTLSDPEGRPTVAEVFNSLGLRVYPVGRLDFATSGLLLGTNDGDFAEGLLHPKRKVPKTYVVKVSGVMLPKAFEPWRTGIQLEDGKTAPAFIGAIRVEGDKTWFELTIHEGRNQQIRRMGEATGFPVMRLSRMTFAGVQLEEMPPGKFRHLSREELMSLKKNFGVPQQIRPSSTDTEKKDNRGRPEASPFATRRAGSAPANPRARLSERSSDAEAPTRRRSTVEGRAPGESRGAAGRSVRAAGTADRGGRSDRGPSDRGPSARGPSAREGAAPRGRRGTESTEEASRPPRAHPSHESRAERAEAPRRGPAPSRGRTEGPPRGGRSNGPPKAGSSYGRPPPGDRGPSNRSTGSRGRVQDTRTSEGSDGASGAAERRPKPTSAKPRPHKPRKT